MAHDAAARQAELNEIRQNIIQYGVHIYCVVGGCTPRFAYTIGLSESLGAELILPATYFYELNEVSKVIKSVIAGLQPTVAWETRVIESASWGTFTLRKVHMDWAKALMLGVFHYYQVEAIQAYQPDAAHWTNEVPDLSQSWSVDLAPAWRWQYEEWPYPVPRNSMALTDLGALRGERITEVMRWEEDEWEIFAGWGPDIPDTQNRGVPLGVLLAADSSLLPAVDLPIERGLLRDEEVESEWRPWGKSEPM